MIFCLATSIFCMINTAKEENNQNHTSNMATQVETPPEMLKDHADDQPVETELNGDGAEAPATKKKKKKKKKPKS